jgi:hypothetical protein
MLTILSVIYANILQENTKCQVKEALEMEKNHHFAAIRIKTMYSYALTIKRNKLPIHAMTWINLHVILFSYLC